MDVQNNQSSGTYTFNPTDDSFIATAGQINGHSSTMSLRNGSSGNAFCAYPVLKFDISSIPPNASSLITSARLWLYYFGQSDNNPANNPLVLHRFLGDWIEEYITKGAMPMYSRTQSAMTLAPGSPGLWISWDVTMDVRQFVSGSLMNYGWILKNEYYWGGAGIPLMYFYSKEHGLPYPLFGNNYK